MTDIVSPKGMKNKQKWSIVEEIDLHITAKYTPGMPYPLSMKINGSENFGVVEDAVQAFREKDWFATTVALDGAVIVRISDKDFDMEAWLCQGNGNWRGGDVERFMLTIAPNPIDPAAKKNISVCKECKEMIENEMSARAAMSGMVNGGQGDDTPGSIVQ